MRALVLRDYWNLEVQDVPDPVVGPTDVLVEIAATGICGSDLHGYTGENGRRQPGQVMGHETAGRIRALGERVAVTEPVAHRRARDFQATTRWVGTTDVPLGRLVEGRIGLDDAPAMFSELANGREHASKVLVLPNEVDRAG